MAHILDYKIPSLGGLNMRIEVRGDGTHVFFHGKANAPCHCGEMHRYNVKSELLCRTDMRPQDMNDLEDAIRGDPKGANRFAWRVVLMLLFAETPPCMAKASV
jgi:hypothetical protein